VEQRHATRKIGLDVRGARYRERHFSDPAQIAGFRSCCAFGIANVKQSTRQCDKEDQARPAPSNHF
jgi:hypothetical protein